MQNIPSYENLALPSQVNKMTVPKKNPALIWANEVPATTGLAALSPSAMFRFTVSVWFSQYE